MAATVNTNDNAALSPRASAGEAIGSLHTPPRRNSSGAARTLSPTWNRIVRGSEVEGLVAPSPPPSESLVAAEAVYEQNSIQGKGGSSPEGFEPETQPEGSDNGNGSKKPAWNKPYNAALESGLVMGAVAWPTLSESTKASPKPPSTDSLKNPCDPPISLPQVTTANASSALAASSSAPQKQMTSNPNNPNPNASQHHGRPARQKSMKREGGGNSFSNGGFSHQFPQSGDTSHTTDGPLKTGSGGSDSSGRDHGHNNATRDGGQRSGGDHPQHRNYRRSNSGPHLRGDGSFGGRRDHDRGNHDWNHNRSFNGRETVSSQQRVGPRSFIRPPPPGAAAYIPLPVRPFGGPMGIPPEMQHSLYYYAPQAGMPFVTQMPPAAVYYPPPDPQLHLKIITQINYYFSNENLIKDTYLRQNMDEHGWVPVQLIAKFKKVMQLTTDIQLILDAVRASTVVEIQGDKIRKRDDWMRWIMPPSVQFPTAAGSQSPRMLQDTLPARVQGLALEEKTANYGNSKSQVVGNAGVLLRSSSGDMNGQSETSKDGRSSSGC